MTTPQDTSAAADLARMAALVHPLAPEQFMADVWPGQFRHFTGAAGRLAELIDDPQLRDIGALVQCPLDGEIRADCTRADLPSEHAVAPERALELYRQHYTLYLTRLAGEPIGRWKRMLDHALGLIPGTTQVNAFASMPGKGLHWHWDPQELFIVQVRGRKLWHVAPNEHLAWPTASGQAGAESRPEIRAQLTDPARPVTLPSEYTTIEMVPGSVLFLPRGYWHTTENVDESVHLVLQTKLLSWRDVFKYLLESVPALYSPAWRKPTTALSPDRLFDQGMAEFQARCAELQAFASPQGMRGLAQLFSDSRK